MGVTKMWTREYIKTRAKEVLKLSYWKAFLVSIVLVIAGADGGINVNYRGSRGHSYNSWDYISNSANPPNYLIQPEANMYSFIGLFIIIAIIVTLVFILFRVLIGYALEVGGRRFFKQATHTDINMGYLGYAFKRERYLDIVKTMLYKGVLNFLWTLLLIIPGIIKGYAYSMVPYILADNPNIGYKRAVELSIQMTDNQKWDMFVLDLSFIGWYLLGLLLLLVGIFFVKPYINATKAELYIVLRQRAIDNGYCTPNELLMENPI